MKSVQFDESGRGSDVTVKDLLGRAPRGGVRAPVSSHGTWRLERKGVSRLARDPLSRLEQRGAYVPF